MRECDQFLFKPSLIKPLHTPCSPKLTRCPCPHGQYLGDVSVLLGVRRTASAKSTTQCTLYRLRKGALLSLLRDYPATEKKMNGVAQSRRRRLAHYLHPTSVALAPGDEIDVEDSKTELFGQDTDRILQDKEKATELDRIHSGIKLKRRHALPST